MLLIEGIRDLVARGCKMFIGYMIFIISMIFYLLLLGCLSIVIVISLFVVLLDDLNQYWDR